MLRILFFSFLSITTLKIYSQQDKNYEFIGALKLPDSSFITYKINFKEIEAKTIEGYSVTDFYGTEKTKSSIIGKLNIEKKTISFHETFNLSTISDAKSNEFCYVHVKNAQLKSKNGKTIIQGKFEGKFKNDTNCAFGRIYLIGTDFLNELNNDTVNGLNKTLKKTEENRLSSKDVLKLNWSSENIVLELWDAAVIDDDQIDVLFNGKSVLGKIVITKEKKILTIPFTDSICKIEIIAISEGNSPPNTVNIILKDNNLSTTVVTNLKQGEKTSLLIKKEN
jgi:hypothetical protein